MNSHFLQQDELTYPKADEFEITVFGPGYGESVVVYIPGIGWGVIDSCEFGSFDHRFVPPLEYLKYQKAKSLAFLVLSHPHLDHICGIDRIINYYRGNIERVCRYDGDGVRELAYYMTCEYTKARQGVKRLKEAFESMKAAREAGAEFRRLGAMTHIIPRKTVNIEGRDIEIDVLSLSPSAYDVEKYVSLLKQVFPKLNREFIELPDRDHNLIASAISIKFGNVHALIGSDVERGNCNSSGWRGIMSSHDVPELKVDFLKVAHHGSKNAHSKTAWRVHCKDENVTSVITPFAKGAHPLPTKDDIKRVSDLSKSLGITSRTNYLRPIDIYTRTITKRLPDRMQIIQNPSKCGWITIRYDTNGNKTVNFAIDPAYWITKGVLAA